MHRDSDLVHAKRGKVRISASQANSFLLRLVNMGDDVSTSRNFQKAFGQRFWATIPSGMMQIWFTNDEGTWDDDPREWKDIPESELIHRYLILPLRDKLRTLWDVPDRRIQEWILFKIREYFLVGDPVLYQGYVQPFCFEIPGSLLDPSPIEQALFYLEKHLPRIKRCRNPGCSSPYFIAPRAFAKFCSPSCALPAQREAKRKWWRANRGPALRRQSRAPGRMELWIRMHRGER